ncbi:hypothetical protein BJ944DRAFT_231190 [Cunninghamella echinulata]|nr:hypothetical protein BJ944DRAFT_231190 [Cunninghamella echinulata]
MNRKEEEDILTFVATGECYYGAASKNKKVFRKEIAFNVSWPATAKDILRILEIEHQWKSEHITDLNKTILPYPGYISNTINDEIHSDINHNFIFKHPEEGDSNYKVEYKELEVKKKKYEEESEATVISEKEHQLNKEYKDNNNQKDNDNDQQSENQIIDKNKDKTGDNDGDKEEIEVDEDDQYYPALKSIVKDGIVWFVLLHPEGHSFYDRNLVDLYAVGFSKLSNCLIGIKTEQVCHNLCD